MKIFSILIAILYATSIMAQTPQQRTALKPTIGADSESIKNFAPFPKAQAGMDRYVIHLQPQTNQAIEALYQVELIVGKTEKVDCNQHRLGGTLADKELSGWGYNYYEFSAAAQGRISTMMACIDQEITSKFLIGATKQLPYNSKLPIVVFVPKGFEVKYRLWKAAEILVAVQN